MKSTVTKVATLVGMLVVGPAQAGPCWDAYQSKLQDCSDVKDACKQDAEEKWNDCKEPCPDAENHGCYVQCNTQYTYELGKCDEAASSCSEDARQEWEQCS